MLVLLIVVIAVSELFVFVYTPFVTAPEVKLAAVPVKPVPAPVKLIAFTSAPNTALLFDKFISKGHLLLAT